MEKSVIGFATLPVVIVSLWTVGYVIDDKSKNLPEQSPSEEVIQKEDVSEALKTIKEKCVVEQTIDNISISCDNGVIVSVPRADDDSKAYLGAKLTPCVINQTSEEDSYLEEQNEEGVFDNPLNEEE